MSFIHCCAMCGKKDNRYDFKIVTSDREVIIYMTGEEDELRLRW